MSMSVSTNCAGLRLDDLGRAKPATHVSHSETGADRLLAVLLDPGRAQEIPGNIWTEAHRSSDPSDASPGARQYPPAIQAWYHITQAPMIQRNPFPLSRNQAMIKKAQPDHDVR